MAQIPVIVIDQPQAITPVVATQAGDSYQNTGSHLLFVYNDSGADIIVTRLVQSQPRAPDDCHDKAQTCYANELTILPALAARRYNDKTGNVQVRYPDAQAANLRVIVVYAPSVL